MLPAKCYVLHVTCDMLGKSFIIYGETGDQFNSYILGYHGRDLLAMLDQPCGFQESFSISQVTRSSII